MRIFALAALMLLVGCRALLHGRVEKAGPAVATVTTSEPGGLRVLASATTDVERIFTETAAIAIGEPVALPGGPIEPRAAAPVLDGAEVPYQALEPASLDAIPDGHFGSVAHSLIFGPDGVPRLCTPQQDELQGRAPRCPANAPALIGGRSRQNTNAFIPGPVVVRRRGSGADVVIELDGTICGETSHVNEDNELREVSAYWSKGCS